MTAPESIGSGSPCDFRCGYFSNGLDLWLHVFREHAPCPECGNKPSGERNEYPVSHKPACPVLQPDYVYPGPIPAEFEDTGDDDDEEF